MSPTSPKAFPVSWDQFHRDCRALAWRLAAAGPFEAIICITRGGLVPAAIVARELDLRLIESVCIASYHDYKNQGELKVLKDIAPSTTSPTPAKPPRLCATCCRTRILPPSMPSPQGAR